jgi:hypothetical protein
MDSRFRGNDNKTVIPAKATVFVIPAKAGIQEQQ